MNEYDEKKDIKPLVICPQAGKQEMFLQSPADICIYGGGKTFALLLECLRYVNNSRFEAVIFRRTRPQIMNAGGLFATSQEIYPHLGGVSILHPNIQWRRLKNNICTYAIRKR